MTRAANGTLHAVASTKGTALAIARAEPPLRFLFPKPVAATDILPAWVCVTTLGGGLVGGDHVDLDVAVDEGATLLVTTQASTKVFRGPSEQNVRAKVEGTLVVLMDPTSCFRDAAYQQTAEIELCANGSLIWLESVTSGRPAFEEAFSFQAYRSSIRVTREGRTLVRDSTSLSAEEGSIAARFDRRGSALETLSTLLALGPRVAPLTDDLLAPADLAPATLAELAVAPASVDRAGTKGALVRVAATSSERAAIETRKRLRNLHEILRIDPLAYRW
ncbi:MAG TPA: urease accessory protein UreD [Polyangiaceae bacterium]